MLLLSSVPANACQQLATDIIVSGTAFASHPVSVDGNVISFLTGQGSLEFSYQRLSRKWCFERRNPTGTSEDSGCITETLANGGEAMLLVKGQLKRSLPLRDSQGNTYAEISIKGDRLTAQLLNAEGALGDQSLTVKDLTDGPNQSLKMATKLCSGAPARCEGASFTTARNGLIRSLDSRSTAKNHGPVDLANTRADFHSRSCIAPYAVLRQRPDFRIAGPSQASH